MDFPEAPILFGEGPPKGLSQDKQKPNPIDTALNQLGFSCKQLDVPRLKSPKIVFQASSLTSPTSFPDRHMFPFAKDKPQRARKREVLEWQRDYVEKLVEAYEKELEELDHLIASNSYEKGRVGFLERRMQDYYSFFASLIDTPDDVFRNIITQMISLQKLWRNKIFEMRKGERDMAEVCCMVSGCPCVAVHGSRFCGWHILKDGREQLFVKCPVCETPRLNNFEVFSECPGHKSKTQQKRKESRRTLSAVSGKLPAKSIKRSKSVGNG